MAALRSTLACLVFTLLAPALTAQVPAPPLPISPWSPLTQGGFEVPDLGTGIPAYAYNPAGSAWTFLGSAGLAGNGSGFTQFNPPAPQGDQVAFIQGQGIVRQQFAQGAGRYRVTFKAAQRLHGGTNTQVLSVRIDGNEIQQIKPAGTSYAPYTTHSFTVTLGFHTFEIVGLNPQGGDNTAFVDDLKLEAFTAIGKKWSDPATWGGTVPGPSSTVTIPANTIVLLDTNAVAKSLTIDGELHCLDQNIALTAESVMVHGRFECGSEVSPFLNTMTLTLTGPVDPTNPFPMGEKVLGSMANGTIELHGEPRVSWTQLAVTAAIGDTSITLASPVDWREHDQIVIAPTREVINEAEVVTITSVSAGGTVLKISPALKHQHWGQQTTYSNGTASWTLDERAEVGLLTRNLKIQGDTSSTSTGLGGHMMTMAGTTTHVSGVEFYRMGQKALLGRYPFHWHLLGSAAGQSIVNSSIHQSFNRCVTVHGTHDTLVADNVCFDFIGHGYFLEDGYELRNTFDQNLGIWAKKPLPGEEVPDADLIGEDGAHLDQRSAPASNGPAVFWIGHPDNVYTGNAAAGSEGTGFWYGMQDAVGEPSLSHFGVSNVNPRLAPFGTFENNRVHSSRQGFSSCRDDGGPFGMEPPNEALLVGLTATNNEQGVWPCAVPQDAQNHRFVHLIVANSPNGMQAPNPMTFEDSAFIAYSPNAPAAAAISGGVDWRGVQVYDQGFHMNGVHFVNFDRPAMSIFFPGSGAHKLSKNRVEGASFDNSPNLFTDAPDSSQVGKGPAEWGDVIHDLDGSLVGSGYAIVNDHPIMYDGSCRKPLSPTIAGYACPYRYGHFRSEHFSSIAPITVMRSDGVHNTSAHIEQRFITEIILNGPYFYTWRYSEGMKHNLMQVMLSNAFPGDTAVYEFLDVPPTVAVTTPGWIAAPDLSSLMAGPGHRYVYRDHSLFLKMQASGVNWHALDVVQLCMTGPGCTAGLLNLGTLPAVTIASPADGAREAAGSPITVNATVTPSTGMRVTLYVGTSLIGVDTIAPFSWTIPSLTAGNYPLKVVAENTAGRSFTAVQQLFVGEPGPRVDITSLQNAQTYDAANPLSIKFNLFNWTVTPGGNHLRLLDNDVDLGPIFSTSPITLTGLTQGEHELELALAQANGTVTAISDRVPIYIMQSQVIADFEDGIDLRTTLTPSSPDVSIRSIDFAWGTAHPVASRLDNEDDINWWDVGNNGAPFGTVTYRLNLTPSQNWVGFTKLEVVTDGIPFEAFVVDAQSGATSIGLRTGTVTVFNLPATSALIDRVVAIEFRYQESQMPTPYGRQHLYRVQLKP